MARFLTNAQVAECVGLDDVLPAVEEMVARYGAGEAENLTRRRLYSPGGYLGVMGGALMYDGMVGVKTFTHTENGYSFQVSLYDASSGALLLYTQANRLGQLRTDATTGVAIKYLSNPDSSTLGVIGAGNQAADQIRAALKVRPIQDVRVFSRNESNRRAFAERMTAELGIPVIAADTNRDAVADRDIVVAIAAAQSPVVMGDWLAAGTTVIGAGPTMARFHEVDAATLIRADRLFVDSLEQAPLECGDIATAIETGSIQWSQISELRRAVAGDTPGRASADEVVYCKLMGTGLADVAAAKVVWQQAEKRDIGTVMDW